MQDNCEMLESIFQNAEMGRDSLGKLIRECNDTEFRGAMATEFVEYQQIITDTVRLMDKFGCKPKCNSVSKAMAFSGMKLNIMVDKTSSHFAEMIIQGSTMGVIDIKRSISELTSLSDDVKELANRLIETEQNNIHGMLQFV